MEDTISISSSESDVEVVGVYNPHLSGTDPMPLSEVRVDVTGDVINHYIDLTDSRWHFPHLKLRKRHKSNSAPIVDLTETVESELESENVSPDCQSNQGGTVLDISKSEDLNQEGTSVSDSAALAPVQGSVPQRQTENQQQNSEAHPCHHKPVVKLTRLPVLESHVTALTTSRCSVELTKVCTQMSFYLRELGDISKTQHSFTDLGTAATSDTGNTEPSLSPGPPVNVVLSHMGLEQNNNRKVTGTKFKTEESEQPQRCAMLWGSERNVIVSSPDNNCVENKKAVCSSSVMISSPTASPSLDQKKSEAHQSHSSGHLPLHPPVRLHTSELFNSDSLSGFIHMKSDVDPPPVCVMQETEIDLGGQSEAKPFNNAFENDSPLSVLWQEGNADEYMNEERSFGRDFRAVRGEDLHYVSPVALKMFMARPTRDPFGENDEGVGAPEVLSRMRLSQVYTTIDVNYPEGTLQLLFDLLQPGYYLPEDITAHLLHGILLNRQSSQHHCVQAFTLLMRAQRHNMVDKFTVPWDWELLTSVIENQDTAEKRRSEIVRMLLEYIIQTLEDDFHANNCPSTLPHSIAKATLSCSQQFSQVRDVIKWLFSVITKSTECEEGNTKARERDEYIRMVTVFQRMLSLALEADGSPAMSSVKLSQELFHMLISFFPLRAHRMLLLKTLESKQLTFKLLGHLLDYACPVKIHGVPMSLSLLLHFLKNSTLVPDPSDGTEKWKKWDELIQLLWMLLFGYNKAMKGYLCRSKMDQRCKVSTLIYKAHDMISASAVREAVEAFLSRSKADLGQELPLHVEESLTYLQDHLLDACQCEVQKTRGV